jgi:hypothetical protein
MPQVWRVFGVNAAVFAGATLLLAVSPATVSFPVTVVEGVVLAGGLAATLAVNLGLLPWFFGSARGLEPSPAAARSAAGRAGDDGEAPARPAGEATVSACDRGHPAHAAPTPAAQGPGMQRLLVCWRRPQGLAKEDAEAWARTELERLLAAERIDSARLTRLRGVSVRVDRSGDWLLELDVEPGCDAQAWLESSAWSAWLSDLHLLELRPQAMVAEHYRVLTVGED